MYNINEQWTVGASYRSKMGMKVKAGNAHVKYANAIAQGILGESLDLINEANFTAEMPCPWVLSLGASYKPVDRLTLALDARLTGWKAYKTLDIEFLSEQLTGYNQYITKNYKTHGASRSVQNTHSHLVWISASDLWWTHRPSMTTITIPRLPA